MKITEKDVEYVAELARLRFSQEETERLTDQLNDILTYMEEMSELDTTGVKPTSHVIPISNVYRDDQVKDSLPIEESLKNAPSRKGNFFRVPKIIE